MSLSGSIYTNVSSHWRLSLEWSATQNIGANTSTVTAKMYWIALDSYGAIYSSSTKSGWISIDGTTYNFSGSGLAALSGNQKKLIATKSKTITHNSDGTRSFSLDGAFSPEVSLNSYVGTVNLTAKTFTLNTIPRASSLKSSPSWTAGNNFTLSISRASSSFTHTAKIYVNGTLIKTISGIGTSASSSFSTTDNTNIFKALDQASSKSSKVTLITYNGGSQIGSKSFTGTVTAPSASKATITNPIGYSATKGQENSTVYIDQSISLSITRYNSAFTHTLNFKDSNSGTVIHSATGVGTSYTWTPSSDEKSKLYAKCPNSNEFDAEIDVYTYYNGVLVRSYTACDINYRVRNSEPSFGTGYTYSDINSGTTSITGDSSYIIQNHSSVRVTIPTSAFATPKNGASMSSYSVTLNGITKTASQGTSNIILDFGTIDASTNQTLSVTAIDSRGNKTTTTKIVKVLPYQSPILQATVSRLNGFENQTIITLKGSISTLTTSSQKNSLKSLSGQSSPLQYQYKESSSASFPRTWNNFTYTTSGGSYSASNVTLNLDNTKSFDFQIRVSDKLSPTTVNVSVNSGQPILFIDSSKKSVGINKFPESSKAFEVNGDLKIDNGIVQLPANKFNSSGGGLNANNSDIVHLNGVYFSDVSDSNNEGLSFLKSGKPDGSQNSGDYDNFRVKDGTAYLNSVPVATSDDPFLWSGNVYPNQNDTVRPSKKITDCPNGWILVWSDYDKGVGVNNYDWFYTPIPKTHPGMTGGGIQLVIGNNSNSFVTKYIYVTESTIYGNSSGGTDGREDVCLRHVLAW